MNVYEFADQSTNAINPILALLVLEEPLLAQREGSHPRWPEFWLRSALSIGIAVGLADAGKHYSVWPGHPSFPSGHTAFAAAASTAIVVRRGPRWLLLVAPLVGTMMWGLVAGGWHALPDVFGGLALGIAVATLLVVGVRLPRRTTV